VVQLSFALMLWAPHAPRFPLAQMSGPEMEEALAANGLSLEPRAPATPDREALWYPGYTEVRASEGDGGSLSLWLDGQAEQGLPMAMAAAVALPEGVPPETVTVHRDRYRLALDVSIRVERGQTYDFTKFIAVSRAGWGGNATDDLALAREARDRGFARLLEEHRAAWDALWQPDILIEGDAKAQQVAHSELYYLLASATADTAWPVGPCGLTTCYAGHAFWDADTWIFPALLLLHPERAKPMVAFRERTLDAARQRARQRGFDGAMYPWESDPENGSEQTPHSAYVLGETEIHVNADVAIAQWQYYLATHDRDWLRAHGWPVIREVARFWASRATYDPGAQRYGIAHVNSVAESNTDIPNDTFTNVSAAKALSIATAAAGVLGERPDPLWSRIARLLYIPLAPGGEHHLAFDPAVMVDRSDEDFGGGPMALLFLPSLDLAMDAQLRRHDYEYGIRPSSVARVAAASMGRRHDRCCGRCRSLVRHQFHRRHAQAALQRAHRDGRQQCRVLPDGLRRISAEPDLRLQRTAHSRGGTHRGVCARPAAGLEVAHLAQLELPRPAPEYPHRARCRWRGALEAPGALTHAACTRQQTACAQQQTLSSRWRWS